MELLAKADEEERRRVKLFDGSIDPPSNILQTRRSLNLAVSIAEICSTITVKSDLVDAKMGLTTVVDSKRLQCH
jgi:hypothetical protein